MSTKSLRDDFLNFYGIPNGPTYYITGKYSYEVPESNKGVRINGTLYKTTQRVRNTAGLNRALHSSAVAFRDEKINLFKGLESISDANTANVSMMFDQLGNGLITYYIDIVKHFASMPITDESMSMVIGHCSTYISTTYQRFTALKSDYDSQVSEIHQNTNISYNNYNAQTKAQMDAAPQFGIFIGNSYTTMFGIERVYGTMISPPSTTQGDAYLAMAENKARAKYEGKQDLRALKKNALYNADSFSTELMKNFRKGLENIVLNNMDYMFDSDALLYDGLENRPYDEKLWRPEINNIKRDDWAKLKYLFNYYNIHCDDYIQTPLFDKLISLYGEKGDFDEYSGEDLEMYYFLTDSTSLKDNFSFQTYLENYIMKKIDNEYKELDIDAAGKTNDIFSDIYNNIDNNLYLDAQRISRIKQYIHSIRAKIVAKRGY